LIIRIVVGGPPHSGKSTFSERLSRAFQNQNIDAEAVDLDEWARTLAFVKKEITKEQRDEQKRKNVTEEDMQKAAQRFRDASEKHDVVIGDAPGGISSLSEIVVGTATHGIIVCKDDEPEAIVRWREFFARNNVTLLGIVHTSLTGNEGIQQNNPIEAKLVNLDQTPTITPVIVSITTLLRRQLGI